MCKLRLTTCSCGKDRRWSKCKGLARTRGLGAGGHRYNPRSSWGAPGPNTDRGPLGAGTHRTGLAIHSSPPRAPALRRGRPRGAERRGRPARTWRQPWLRWWSTRDSRPATAAATATPRRARRPVVSGPTNGMGAAAWRPNPHTARRAPGQALAVGSTQAPLPSSRFPTPRVSSQTVALHILSLGLTLIEDGGLFRRKSGNSGRLPSVKMAQAASAPRALPARLGLLAPGRRGALWGGGGGCWVGLGRASRLRGLGPWRPGPRFRPASWNISRARTSTVAATARTSRAVAPMVSGPGWWAGKGAGGSAAGGCPRGVAASRAEWLEGRVQAAAQA